LVIKNKNKNSSNSNSNPLLKIFKLYYIFPSSTWVSEKTTTIKRKLLEQLTKSRNSLKRKFHELKQIKNENVSNLEETCKPIAERLHELLTENKKLNKK